MTQTDIKMKLVKQTKFFWRAQLTLLVSLILSCSTIVYAGISDHLGRAATIKHFEGNNVSTLSQYSNATYLIELIALGLVAAALLAVTFSIFTRQSAGKREHKKILSLRRSAEEDRKIFDETLSEIDNIGQQLKKDAVESKEQLIHASEKADEIEHRAETIATIEVDMKQLVQGTTERMNHVQEYWDQKLKETTDSINLFNANLESGLIQSAKQSSQAEALLQSLSDIKIEASCNDGKSINEEIKDTLDLALTESKELLSQIKDYKQQTEVAYSSFTTTLGSFESQAHEQFDDIFNTADMARQELNANLDESREYMKIFRKEDKLETDLILEGIDKNPDSLARTISDENSDHNTDTAHEETTSKDNEDIVHSKSAYTRKGRPIIGMTDAQDLTDPSLIKEYGSEPIEPANEDKNLVSLFSKFRHHGS